MYYRRKVILSILEVFENKLEKFQLQKLLMLFTTEQSKHSYFFIPYKYGCFSFQANADLSTMQKYGWVEEDETHWNRITKQSYIKELKEEDKLQLDRLKKLYKDKSSDFLIKYTYKKHPYYAINSKIVNRVLSKTEREEVEKMKPKSDVKALFTIGYEGISIEQYINKLIKADVKVLCDVRKNSFSMKYGFNKSQLKMACEGVGIQFMHLPEVGIVSAKRKELKTQKDYDLLFEDYKQTVLTETLAQQKEILNLIKKKDRVAITCFEKDICQCHRKPLAEAVAQLPGFNFELIHL